MDSHHDSSSPELLAPAAGLVETAQLEVTSRNPLVLGTKAVFAVLSPAGWSRPVRMQLDKQVYFSVARSLPFVVCGAILGGPALFAVCDHWFSLVGMQSFLPKAFGAVLIGELAPMAGGAVVILASLSAITAELAVMKESGQIRLLATLGVPPETLLVLPRLVGLVAGAFCLAVCFAASALLAGHAYQISMSRAAVDNLIVETLIDIDPTLVCLGLAKCVLVPVAVGCYGMAKALSLPQNAPASAIPGIVSRVVLRSITFAVLVWAATSIVYYAFLID